MNAKNFSLRRHCKKTIILVNLDPLPHLGAKVKYKEDSLLKGISCHLFPEGISCFASGLLRSTHLAHQLFLLLWYQNRVIKGVFPASPSSWLFVAIGILATMYMQSDPSMGLIAKIQQHLPLSLHVSLSAQGQTMLSALVFSTLLWLSLILALRFCLKLLLSYHQWMFEKHGRISNTTKVWVVSDASAWFHSSFLWLL
uniref:Uncharacterized protein n=1 Tax=Acanthochromis polyacanthus TaxID=80966 RepID=A0A3Q1FQ80_9TELE